MMAVRAVEPPYSPTETRHGLEVYQLLKRRQILARNSKVLRPHTVIRVEIGTSL